MTTNISRTTAHQKSNPIHRVARIASVPANHVQSLRVSMVSEYWHRHTAQDETIEQKRETPCSPPPSRFFVFNLQSAARMVVFMHATHTAPHRPSPPHGHGNPHTHTSPKIVASDREFPPPTIRSSSVQTSWMVARSCSRMAENSSMQQSPLSARTNAPASSIHSPPSYINNTLCGDIKRTKLKKMRNARQMLDTLVLNGSGQQIRRGREVAAAWPKEQTDT